MQHYVFIAAVACPLLGIKRDDIVRIDEDSADPVLLVRALPVKLDAVLDAVEAGALMPHGAVDGTGELAAVAGRPAPAPRPDSRGLRARLRRLQLLR